METRLITFRKLSGNCHAVCHEFYNEKTVRYCANNSYYNLEKLPKCTAANCPVWKGLTETEITRKKIRGK